MHITIDNYLSIKFESNLLIQMLNNISTNIELKIKLFELSLTEQYDNDTRKRIELDVDNLEFFDNILSNYKKKMNKYMNEYTYMSNNFNFIKKMPNLIHLNSQIKNKNLTSIDLSGLSNIQSIGNEFMWGCLNLTSIDLSVI